MGQTSGSSSLSDFWLSSVSLLESDEASVDVLVESKVESSLPFLEVVVSMVRARPKSQSLTWHSSLTSMLVGLMSLWMMFS